MSKRRYGGEQTKNHIADQAKTLFSQKGYAATSMDDICNATGRSIGNIYYYFKSKDDLFLYLVEQTFTEWRKQLQEIFSQYESTTEKLYAYSDFLAGIERPLHSVEREFISIVGVDSEAGQKFMTMLNESFTEFQKLISEGIAGGELKNEDLFELTFIVTSFYGGLSRYASLMDKDTKKVIFQKGTTLLLQGIINRNHT